jgi:phosphopantetheine--protein transferase-like protein
VQRFFRQDGLSAADIEILADDDGAPRVRPLAVEVSISHTTGYAAAAAAKMPVGIDIEQISERDPALARHFLSADERTLLPSLLGGGSAGLTGMWALKEATLKALRLGLRLPPRSVVISWKTGLHITVAGQPDLRVCRASVRRWEDHVLAIVTLSPAPTPRGAL